MESKFKQCNSCAMKCPPNIRMAKLSKGRIPLDICIDYTPKMSEVKIFIPDDGWFQLNCDVKPTDKMLCVVIHRYGNRSPEIYQFREANELYEKSDYFLNVSDKWRLDSLGCGQDWCPEFLTLNLVHKWKPLGLPANENERILLEIEKWLEESMEDS